jgi:hypothetical protein
MDNIIPELCRILGCKPNQLVSQVMHLKIMDSCFCDKEEDRLYHASDNTWWMRRAAGGKLVRADPPKGWEQSS